jgi:hypothetical protein
MKQACNICNHGIEHATVHIGARPVPLFTADGQFVAVGNFKAIVCLDCIVGMASESERRANSRPKPLLLTGAPQIESVTHGMNGAAAALPSPESDLPDHNKRPITCEKCERVIVGVGPFASHQKWHERQERREKRKTRRQVARAS